MPPCDFDFCGIGNACIDIVAGVDDLFLQEWGFQKGICTPLSADTASRLGAALKTPKYIPGGCAANAASCIAALGGRAAFMGRTSDDAIGAMFTADLRQRSIHYSGQPDRTSGTGSTRVFVLITPDRQRTFASYYGAQEDLSGADLDIPAIQGARFLYLDGYALNSVLGGKAFLRAAEIARAAGRSVVFAPNDISILTNYSATVAQIIGVTDFFFCNDSEALFLTRKPTLDDALRALQSVFPRGAVTVGESGAWVFDAAGIRHVPAVRPTGPIIDTNGAGDNFAGGCLFGLARGLPLDQAARLGNLCAAAIIIEHGPRPVKDYRSLLTLPG